MKLSLLDNSNAICGLILIVFGAAFAIQSLGLEIGDALRMGPGYLPFVLALVLIFLGSLIFINAFRSSWLKAGHLAWRGMLFVLPAPIFFGLTVRGLGFVPATFICSLYAAFASERMRPVTALLLALGITVFSTALFSYGLGLPFERFGPWMAW